MKKQSLTIVAAIVFLLAVCEVQAVITDVNILPQTPTTNDAITIITSGIESTGSVSIDSSTFVRDGTSLHLDICLHAGFFTVMTPWSYSDDIGILPIGTYGLTVREFKSQNLTSTYSTTFKVVPEPATILLLTLGAIGIRAVNRKTSP